MKDLEDILCLVAEGKLSVRQAVKKIRINGISEVEEHAKIDVNRNLRTGLPEVILAEGKTSEQIVKIAKKANKPVVFSRLSQGQVSILKKKFKGEYNKHAKTFVIGTPGKKRGKVGIITAGTSDMPVAEEAKVMVEAMGCSTMTTYDAGVAGIHRLFPPLKKMVGKVDVIVVVAGREGTLPSIVAGLVDVPVIGVPTSTGYGYGGEGDAALRSMLQSCSFITVVNIDNGIGAGASAALIARGV